MYRKLFTIHSWMGLCAGAVLLVAGLSGSILLFKGELERLLHPEWTRVQQAGPRLSLGQALLLVEKARPGRRVEALHLEGWEEPGRAWRWRAVGEPGAYPGYGNTVYVDPYRGAVLSERQGAFLDWLYYLHFELLFGWFGRGVMFFFGLFMFLLGLSGFYLYRDGLKAFMRWPRRHGGLRQWLSDWHKLAGLGSLALFLVIGFSGAYMNYRIFPWFFGDLRRTLHFGVAGDYYSPKAKTEEAAKPALEAARPRLGSLEGALKEAQVALPGLRPVLMDLPAKAGEPLLLHGSGPGWGRFFGDYGATVELDPGTGKVLKLKRPWDEGLGAAFSALSDALHVGRYGGLPVRLLYAFFGLLPGLLAVTGFIMFLKRRKAGPPRRA